MSFRMSKINSIGLFIAPYGRAIEEPKAVLTFNPCQLLIFFNRLCEIWCHFCVRCEKFSRSNQSRTKPRLTYVSLSYETKLFFCEICELNILGRKDSTMACSVYIHVYAVILIIYCLSVLTNLGNCFSNDSGICERNKYVLIL